MAGFCTTMTSHETPVATPPTSANTGQSTPRARRFGRARNATSSASGGGRIRIRTSAACATVNESVAPKA